MKFDDLVKRVLENTTMTTAGMPMTGTVFSGDTYNRGSSVIAGLIGGGKVITRNKPELITTPLFKGIRKKVVRHKKKHHKK